MALKMTYCVTVPAGSSHNDLIHCVSLGGFSKAASLQEAIIIVIAAALTLINRPGKDRRGRRRRAITRAVRAEIQRLTLIAKNLSNKRQSTPDSAGERRLE